MPTRPQDVFAVSLGEEDSEFIYYHLRRTTATICSHAALVVVYILSVALFYHDLVFSESTQYAAYGVLVLCLAVWVRAGYWAGDDFSRHPAVQPFKYAGLTIYFLI